MKIIAVIDDDFGMMFNHRRQSQDKLLRERILQLCENKILRFNSYTQKQFETIPNNVFVSDTFLYDAKDGEYCFVEDQLLSNFSDKIEELILFYWNRRYPSDLQLDFLPQNHHMNIIHTEDFFGTSHDKITMEKWIKIQKK